SVARACLMAKPHRIIAVALVVSSLLTLAPPAGAESTSSARRRRAQVTAKRAELARKIDALKATDDQLDRAVQALTAQGNAQQARAEAAHQAVAQAERRRSEANTRIQETKDEIGTTRTGLVARVVAAYVRPQGEDTGTGALVGVEDMGEASRRVALL